MKVSFSLATPRIITNVLLVIEWKPQNYREAV